MAWSKGTSGNPGGKPKGQTPRGLFRQQVNEALPSIVEGLITAAKDGDVQAARLILDKVLPNLKPQADTVKLPISKGASLADQGAKVVAATAAGTLGADDAQAAMNLLVSQAKLIEQTEVLERLEIVEKWLAKGDK